MRKRDLMENNAEVSVIVPIYNVAEYLEKCISSIIGQTYNRLQIILVDDGSTDGSAQICDQYAGMDSRVIVIHKKNEGLVRARKSGLAAATGKYICYVDGDDWIEADMIESLSLNMMKYEVDLVVSNYYCDMFGYAQKVLCKLETGVHETKDIIPIMLYAEEFYQFGISQFIWAKLFRKDILWDIQMQVDNEINCGEDVAVTYPYILQTRKVYLSDLTGYHYIQRSGSMMDCYDANELVRNKSLVEYLKKTFSQSLYSQCLDRQLNQYVKNLLLTRDIAYFDLTDRNQILAPYGGIPLNARVIIYGAGKMGQSLWRYVKGQTTVKVIAWLDKNYAMYRKLNLYVNDPAQINSYDQEMYDYIILAINRQSIARSICKYLESMGVDKKKIRWLSEDFVKEDNYILNHLL